MTRMLSFFKKMAGFSFADYPGQFKLMFFGMLVSTAGMSMVWPFLLVYAKNRLGLSLTVVASLFTLGSVMSILSSLLGGPVIDRIGRKWMMVISLGLNGLGYLLLSQASSYAMFALAMGLNGVINPLYRISADAMMADLIVPEKRAEAYSIMRLANNLGISVGPILGGLLASISYTIIFSAAAAGLVFYGVLILLFAAETIPQEAVVKAQAGRERFGGYGRVFANTPFISMVGGFALVQICANLIWVLLADYAKTNYHVGEGQYGLIPTTNALMVVLFQMGVTRFSKRFPPLAVMAVGAFFYGAAVLGVAFGSGFWAFWVCMVVMTLGELALVPTTSTYAANLAPVDQRARYMSLYGMTWNMANAVGPVFGGVLNDNLGPKMIWYGGGVVGAISVAVFLWLDRAFRPAMSVDAQPAAAEPPAG